MTDGEGGKVRSLFDEATAHHLAGRLAEAERLYAQALALDPEHVDSLHNLGLIAYGGGRAEAALELFEHAAARAPARAELQNSLGAALRAVGRIDAAAEAYRRALALRPGYAEAHRNLGNLWLGEGRLEEADAAYRQAMALGGGLAESEGRLAAAFQKAGRFAEAARAYERALVLKPDWAMGYNNLANLMMVLGRYEAGEGAARRAVALKPDFALGHATLGGVLAMTGGLKEADASYARALELDPDHEPTWSNRLFCLNYAPGLGPEAVFDAYRAYGARFGPPPSPPAARSPDGRRLRIGYVSADFRRHACRHFLLPVFERHDRTAFEIHAYSQTEETDELTETYRSLCDSFVPTLEMDDDTLAERIRADGIDLLIDLAGHTQGNRLPVFAKRPAPVSAAWIGTGYTTGLKAIDYFLADATMTPPGSEALFSETPWRLAHTYCFRPDGGMGEPGPLPAERQGHVTFGMLSRAIRVNDRTVRVWADLLARVEGARLIVDSRDFREPAMQARLRARFAEHGIGGERLEIGFHTPPWDLLRRIDIGLDCFPHNSGTTLAESFYMGVPVVTLAGRPSVGRIGSAFVGALGRIEWIAPGEAEYVDIAAGLAADLPALARLRAGLRTEMEASALMDEQGFVQGLETAYRAMVERGARA